MNALDDLFTITCGKCGTTEPVKAWCRGWLVSDFECPSCGYAFRRRAKSNRKSWEKFVELVEIEKIK